MDGRMLMISSGRGGSGKSAVAAGLARAFAARGKRTVLLDLDFSEPALDLLLGCEDRVVYDLADLLRGDRTVAGVAQEVAENLFLIPGTTLGRRIPSKEELAALFSRVSGEFGAEILIADTGRSSDPAFPLCASLTDRALVVMTPGALSLRSASAVADRLRDEGARDLSLVVNRFPITRRKRTDLRAMIDETGVPLVGVVPDREDPLSSPEVLRAFDRIAARLLGVDVPLLRGACVFREKLLHI